MFKKIIITFYKSRKYFSSFPQRSTYQQISNEDITYFQTFLQPHEIITDSSELISYNTDWKKIYQGFSKIVLKPNSSSKNSKILKYCNFNNIAVVPQGGNTGLVGGSIPIFDELILSLNNMNKIEKFDQNTSVISCEAGCILEQVNNYLGEYGYEIPLDLGAKGSCQIGGNIATHAGGIHFIKYGPFRGNILGLEVALPNGDIMNLESDIRKDNTGFDLKQAFIGSEGTLGVIMKAQILCAKIDRFKRLILIRCQSYEKVLTINRLAKDNLGKNLSAIEFFDYYAYESVIKYIPNLVVPFPLDDNDKNFFVLVELASSQSLEKQEESFYEILEKNVDLNDCIVCQNDTQANNVWKIRESIATASNHMGTFLIYDFSVDITKWIDLIYDIRAKTKNKGYTIGYGHIGDGNLHVNIVYPPTTQREELEKILEPYCFEWLKKEKGSISAEHGIGFMKANYLKYAKDDNTIKYMRMIKDIFDPNRILNPYKMFPISASSNFIN